MRIRSRPDSPEQAADFGDALGKRILGDRQARPIRGQQFILGNNPSGVRRKMPQHAKRSIPQIDASAGRVAQFLLPKIERQVGDLQPIRRAQAA